MLKKIFCKFFAATLAIVVFINPTATAIGIGAFPENLEVTTIGLGVDEPSVSPCGIIGCSGSPSGIHEMEGRASGWAYYGYAGSTDLIVAGQASQCVYCYLVMITEYNPFMYGCTKLGTYADWNPNYEVGNNVVMYTTSTGYNDNINDSFGRQFHFG